MYTNNYSNSVSTNSLYKVYSWMMVGLGITAITSALLYASGIFMLIIQIPMISLLLFIVQISLTISMGRQLSRNTPASTMKTMFIVYSLTMGINMTSLKNGLGGNHECRCGCLCSPDTEVCGCAEIDTYDSQ